METAKHCFQGNDEAKDILCAVDLGCQKCVSCMAAQATKDHIDDALKVTKAKKAAEDEEQKKKAEAEEIAKKIDVASKAAGDEAARLVTTGTTAGLPATYTRGPDGTALCPPTPATPEKKEETKTATTPVPL